MVGKPDTIAAGQYLNSNSSKQSSQEGGPGSFVSRSSVNGLLHLNDQETPKVQQRSKGLDGEAQSTEVFVLSTNYLGFHAGPDDFYIHFGG